MVLFVLMISFINFNQFDKMKAQKGKPKIIVKTNLKITTPSSFNIFIIAFYNDTIHPPR